MSHPDLEHLVWRQSPAGAAAPRHRDRRRPDLPGHQSASSLTPLRPVRPVPGPVGGREMVDPGSVRHRGGWLTLPVARRTDRRNATLWLASLERLRPTTLDPADQGQLLLAQARRCLLRRSMARASARLGNVSPWLWPARPTSSPIPFGIDLLRAATGPAATRSTPAAGYCRADRPYDAAQFGSPFETGRPTLQRPLATPARRVSACGTCRRTCPTCRGDRSSFADLGSSEVARRMLTLVLVAGRRRRSISSLVRRAIPAPLRRRGLHEYGYR